MTSGQRKALQAAHSPAARKRATKKLMALAHQRNALARKYNTVPGAFTSGQLLETIDRLKIPLSQIPVGLIHVFPAGVRKQLMAERANGHDKGGRMVGIPLAAIPDRKAPASERAGWGTKKPKGHPNADIISKTLDLIASPKTTDKVASRLLAAMEKLLM